jgi:hypothetical protein
MIELCPTSSLGKLAEHSVIFALDETERLRKDSTLSFIWVERVNQPARRDKCPNTCFQQSQTVPGQRMAEHWPCPLATDFKYVANSRRTDGKINEGQRW